MEKSASHPKRLRAAERKEQILAATLGLVSRQGFRSVSMRQIAGAAGINEALIYRHFPSKEELLRAMLSEVVARQPVRAAAPAASLQAFTRQLGSFIDFYLQNGQTDPTVIRLILYAVMEDYPLPPEFDLGREGTVLNWLYRSIEKGQAEWGFDPALQPLAAVSSFMGGLVFYTLQTAVLKAAPGLDRAAFRQAYLRSFLRSLAADPERNP